MLGETLTITYDGASKALRKINQDGFSAEYYLDDSSNQMVFKAKAAHTIPDRGSYGESHMFRIDVEHFDANGVYVRTESVWTVIKTFDANQIGASIQKLSDAHDTLVDSAFSAQLIARES